MNESFSWIESAAWELDFFGLPHRIPWPADEPVDEKGESGFNPEILLRGVEALEKADPAAAAPWLAFAQAAEHIPELNEALEGSEYVEAAELLAKFEAAHPGSPYALFHTAYLERQNGRDAESLALYQKAAEKAPGLGFIWSHLGGMLGEAGRHPEAIEAFKKALESNGSDVLALEGLVQLRAAVKLFKDPKDPKSVVYLPMEKYREVAAQQVDALTADPDQLVGFGEYQLREGTAPEVGILALEKAAELRPDHARTLMGLGAAYRMTGQTARAVETLEKVAVLEPQNPWAFFNLAQAHNAAGNKAGEVAALDKVLELDANFQPAIGIRFEVDPANPANGAEGKIENFGATRNSWMAYLIASSLARDRGDIARAQELAEKAYAINSEMEEVLLHLSSVLGDTKDAAKLAETIEPAVRRGKYSKRLDWNYAQALRQLDRTSAAIALLRDAATSDGVQADFKQAAAVAIDFWNGLLAESGVRLEVHRAGALRRPVLLTLEDGDGGVLIGGGKPLPAKHRFQFRTKATGDTEARVSLQQGQSGGNPGPVALGTFVVSGISPKSSGPTNIECFAGATNDGTLRFGAIQDGKKLKCAWSEPA